MKYVLIIAALLLLGCTGPAAPSQEQPSAPAFPGLGGEQTEECIPDYSFSGPEDSTFSKGVNVIGTATCAGGSEVVVKVDGEEAREYMIESNGTTPLTLGIVADKEGTREVVTEINGEVVYSTDWNVASLGSVDTRGSDYDSFSFKEWIAQAYDIENAVEVGQVRAFMKRQTHQTQESTMIIAEIRNDADGEPGNTIIASKKLPVGSTTQSENWITFEFDSKAKLDKGTYWVVLRIEQTEETDLISDVVIAHFIAIDKQKPGNEYTREMKLSVDEKTGAATETEWVPVPYDREYTIVLEYGN